MAGGFIRAAVLAAALTTCAAPALAAPPFDYTRVKGLSKPVHGKAAVSTQDVEMDDGVTIHLEIARPAGDRRYGVILQPSPYYGTSFTRDGGKRFVQVSVKGEGQTVRDWYVPRGYAVVSMDLRGTGKSGGCLEMLTARDRADLKAVIEHLADQPWSNGRVGVYGHSYNGAATNLAATSGARGLAAVVPSASLARMYDHQFQAGVPYWLQYAGVTIGYPLISLSADLPGGLSTPLGGDTGDDFGGDPSSLLCSPPSAAAASGAGQVTGQEDAWHKARDFADAARDAPVPVFYHQGVNDSAARVATLDWFTRRQRAGGARSANDKLWLGQWDHASTDCCYNPEGVQFTLAVQAFFDRWVQGRRVRTGPKVEAFMTDEQDREEAKLGRGEIYTARSWPPPAKAEVLATGRDGSLRADGGEPGTVSFAGDPAGFQDNAATGGADFATEPAARDTLYIGVPELALSLSQSVEQLNVIATLFDEDAEGARRRITQCAINPLLRGGTDHVEPVVPGERMDLAPPCFAMAHHLRRGHRLLLRVTTSDPDKVPLFATDPNVAVHAGPQATRITLPRVDDRRGLAPNKRPVRAAAIGL